MINPGKHRGASNSSNTEEELQKPMAGVSRSVLHPSILFSPALPLSFNHHPPLPPQAEQQDDPCLLRGPPVLEKMKLVVWNPHREKNTESKDGKMKKKLILSCLCSKRAFSFSCWMCSLFENRDKCGLHVLWFEQKETNVQEIVSTYTEICYSVSFSVWNKPD